MTEKTFERPASAIDTVGIWPLTSRQHYITGISALNIPDPAGTGDWHFGETFEGTTDREPRRLVVAGVDVGDSHAVFADQGVFDARARLEARGLTPPPGPVWAADHYRAIADMLLHAVAQQWDFEKLLNLDDWLCQPAEQECLTAFLQPARQQVSEAQWERIGHWLMDSLMNGYR